MKETYTAPELEIIELEYIDTIFTSCTPDLETEDGG